MILFVLLMIIIVVVYLVIVCILLGVCNKSDDFQKRMVVIFLILSLIFIVIWLFFKVINYIFYFQWGVIFLCSLGDFVCFYYVIYVMKFFYYFNLVVNFIIYVLCVKDFRKGVRCIFYCCCEESVLSNFFLGYRERGIDNMVLMYFIDINVFFMFL